MGAQKDEGPGDVVHVVLEGVLDGFPHIDEGGKVNHGVKVALHQERIYHGGISQIPFDQFHFRVHEGSRRGRTPCCPARSRLRRF